MAPPEVGSRRLKPPANQAIAAQSCSLDLYIIIGDWHSCSGAYVTCLKRAESDLQCHYLRELLEAP